MNRFKSLDILRGFAALAVVVYHATMQHHPIKTKVVERTAEASATEWLLYICQAGYLGVPVFFMISGFCISAAAVNHREKQHSIKRYASRRFQRIYPAYWICIALFGLVAAVSTALPLKLTELSVSQWLGNLFLIEEWRPYVFGPASTSYFLAVAWTLCYEEQFYFLVGTILLICPRALFFVLAAITVFVFLNTYNWCVGPLTRLSPLLEYRLDYKGLILDKYWIFFASGIALYLFCSSTKKIRFLVPITIFMLLCWELRQLDWHTNRFMSRVVTFGTTLCLCVFNRFDDALQNWRFVQPLNWLGARTYSIYLIHLPVVQLIVLAESRIVGVNSLYTLLVTVPISVLASIVFGHVFYRFVERRFIPPPSTKTAVV